ncbi:MAG: CHAP domain-containing protein [Thermocrispum sp.]
MMTPEELAQQFGRRILANRDKLSSRADDAVQVLYAIHKSTTVIETERAEHREASKRAQEDWRGRGAQRYESRSGHLSFRMRQTRDVTEDAEKAVTSAMQAVTGNHTAADRLVTEYTTNASNVLRAGMSATGVGSTAALIQAIARVSDELEPNYRRLTASALRTAHGELEQAARTLRTLTKELATDGFADPGDPDRKQPGRGDKGSKGGKGDEPRGKNKRSREILSAARKNLGYRESGDNVNKFGPAGQPWCAYFATDLWRKAGVDIPNYGFTGDVYRWGQEHDKAYGANNLERARPGDVLLFGTGPSSPSTSTHIGIVEKVDGNTVTLIEGNASDSVRRNTHTLSSATFYGGVHP